MPVHMHMVTQGKDKGKWVVLDPDGTRIFGPTTRQKAREVTQGRNLGEMRGRGDTRAPAKRKH